MGDNVNAADANAAENLRQIVKDHNATVPDNYPADYMYFPLDAQNGKPLLVEVDGQHYSAWMKRSDEGEEFSEAKLLTISQADEVYYQRPGANDAQDSDNKAIYEKFLSAHINESKADILYTQDPSYKESNNDNSASPAEDAPAQTSRKSHAQDDNDTVRNNITVIKISSADTLANIPDISFEQGLEGRKNEVDLSGINTSIPEDNFAQDMRDVIASGAGDADPSRQKILSDYDTLNIVFTSISEKFSNGDDIDAKMLANSYIGAMPEYRDVIAEFALVSSTDLSTDPAVFLDKIPGKPEASAPSMSKDFNRNANVVDISAVPDRLQKMIDKLDTHIGIDDDKKRLEEINSDTKKIVRYLHGERRGDDFLAQAGYAENAYKEKGLSDHADLIAEYRADPNSGTRNKVTGKLRELTQDALNKHIADNAEPEASLGDVMPRSSSIIMEQLKRIGAMQGVDPKILDRVLEKAKQENPNIPAEKWQEIEGKANEAIKEQGFDKQSSISEPSGNAKIFSMSADEPESINEKIVALTYELNDAAGVSSIDNAISSPDISLTARV